jgi:hypothetical protein
MTHYLYGSSERLDLGLEKIVIDKKGNVGDGKEDGLSSEQEDLVIDEL